MFNNLKIKIKYAWQRLTRGYDDRLVYNFYDLFLEYVPKILEQLNNNRYGHPCELTNKKWGTILNKMIECFNEANENTCTKVNKYQEDYDKMLADFEKEFGVFGEKLPQPEECIKEGTIRMYTPRDKEVGHKEWSALSKKYDAEENKIYEYRDKKLKEGLELFSKYFWDLWD